MFPGHHKKPLSNNSSVRGYSAPIPAWGAGRTTDQEDTSVEGNVGRVVWEELLWDQHPARRDRAACPCPCLHSQEAGTGAPTLCCSSAALPGGRDKALLMVFMILTRSGLFTRRAFYTSLLAQKAKLAKLTLTELLWSPWGLAHWRGTWKASPSE